MKKLSIISLFALLLVAVGLASAQPAAARPTPAFPFAPGEKLTYEGKINKFAVSVTIGDIIFEVGPVTEDKIRLKVDARSRGTMLKLFRYSFLQQIDTLADARELYVYNDSKRDEQKERIRDSVAAFDYGKKMVTWVETDPNEPTKPPRTIASDLDGPTHNIVSAIYLLRTLPLAVGYSTNINVSDSGLVYKIPVRVVARERQKTIFGDVWCFRVEPELFGPGRFFEQKGKMEIWVTEDARRIPVRARVNAEVGKADIKLKDVTNPK
ncbi:MAG: DUF3108 domain-containing protein [Pyrinomonadaceae bacterium]